MRFLAFECHDEQFGWTVERFEFGWFDLLVGISGVGKSRIVRALGGLCAAVHGESWRHEQLDDIRGLTCRLDFEHEGSRFSWAARFEPEPTEYVEEKQRGALPLVSTETLTKDSTLIVDRTADRLLVNGIAIPRLDRSKSTIALLKEDPAFTSLHHAFARTVYRQLEITPSHTILLRTHDKQMYPTPESVTGSPNLPLHHKASLLHELYPERFQEIVGFFRDAFPFVEAVEVVRFVPPGYDLETSKIHSVTFKIREKDVPYSIPFHLLSSGMKRYLAFLVHLSCLPDGTVVLIDELETSFGVNCLGPVADFLLSLAHRLQFIITSHHPYIIQKIPISCWKIVTRHGPRVRVLDASKIEALADGATNLDRFTRLINLPAYEDGIDA